MKLNSLYIICWIGLVILLLGGCMNKYYDQFGGYPLDSEEITFTQDGVDFKLLITYRYPYQDETADSTKLNITVKTVIAREDLNGIRVEKLVLKAVDGTYLYTYNHPAIYDINGKYPIKSLDNYKDKASASNMSDEICLFTVNRSSHKYELIIGFSALNQNRTLQHQEKAFPIDISDIKTKIKNPEKNTPGTTEQNFDF